MAGYPIEFRSTYPVVFMHMRQRVVLAAFFLSAMIFAACGAKQGGKIKIDANWNALYDAVPADAMYSFGHVMDGDGEPSNGIQGLMRAVFENNFGAMLEVVWSGQLMADAEITAFARGDANWLIAEVSDMPHVMERLSDHYQALAENHPEHMALEQDRVGERVIFRVQDGLQGPETVYLEITGAGDYVIARAARTLDQERVDAGMRALSMGWKDVGRYAETADGRAQRARAGGQPLESWAMFDVKQVNTKIQDREARGGIAELAQMFGPDDVEVSESCDMLNARLESLIPSAYMTVFTDADGYKHTENFLKLSEVGVANGRTLMRGAPSLEGFAQDALLSLGVSFDFGAFVAAMEAQPAHANCGGLAGIAGSLAEYTEEYAAHIKFNARTVTGTGAVVIEDVNLQGFIPTANAGVFIESPNAEALFQRVVRALSKMGSPEVLSKASAPAVEISLLSTPMRLRVQQSADRVIIYTSTLNEALIARLFSVVPHADANVPLNIQLNDERLQALMEDVRNYVEDMQMEGGQVNTALNLMDENASGFESRIEFEADGLRLTVEQKPVR